VKSIDLNADLGESYGAWRMGDDAGMMPWITSANLACGFHAGDPATMQRSITLCMEHDVAIGAHPSLPDLQGFGRREMPIAPSEAYAQTLYQVGALDALVKAAGGRLHHVKPHGALYNMAARDPELADAIAAAVRDFAPTLILVGLAGSALVAAGRRAGLPVLGEGFCDRRYRPDGSLAARSEPGAVIDEPDAAVAQAISLACRGEAVAVDGNKVQLDTDTLCVHGDRANAAALAKALHEALEGAGLKIAAVERPA
jgi:UPF0271 protein